MSEWWTYTLSDFLLFSPRTYYRLIEIYNAAIWPAQIVAIAAGLGLAVAVLRPARSPAAAGRIAASILAAGWLWVAIAFHANRYATINWAAVYFAWGFGLEAALLVWIGIVRGGLRFAQRSGFGARAGALILLFALAVEPFAAPLLGRGWRQAEIFGVLPDPTAVATLGGLLASDVRVRWRVMLIPVTWCLMSGATLLAMKSPDAWVTPLAALVATTLAIRQTRARRRSAPTVGA